MKRRKTYDKLIARNISSELVRKGKEQADLARYLDITPQQVSLYLTAKGTLSFSYAIEIARFLDVPITFLYREI